MEAFSRPCAQPSAGHGPATVRLVLEGALVAEGSLR